MTTRKFIDLDGVKSGVLYGPFAKSTTAAMRALKSFRVVSGAGNNGSWTVWIDDDGAYHVDFSRFRFTKNKAVFGTKKQVKEWLQIWIPECK